MKKLETVNPSVAISATQGLLAKYKNVFPGRRLRPPGNVLPMSSLNDHVPAAGQMGEPPVAVKPAKTCQC